MPISATNTSPPAIATPSAMRSSTRFTTPAWAAGASPSPASPLTSLIPLIAGPAYLRCRAARLCAAAASFAPSSPLAADSLTHSSSTTAAAWRMAA